jgi:hypothetical protein
MDHTAISKANFASPKSANINGLTLTSLKETTPARRCCAGSKTILFRCSHRDSRVAVPSVAQRMRVPVRLLQDASKLLVLYEAPAFEIQMAVLSDKLTLPHVEAFKDKHSLSELLFLIKVQAQPGDEASADKSIPLRNVLNLEPSWLIQKGGEVLRDNLEHDSGQFVLWKLPVVQGSKRPAPGDGAEVGIGMASKKQKVSAGESSSMAL